MALPSSRNTTYTPGSTVLAADLNALQDCVIGGKLAPTTIEIGGMAWTPAAAMTPFYSLVGGLEGPIFNAFWALPLPIGVRITAVRWYVRDNVTGPTTLQAFFGYGNRAGVQTIVSTSAVSAGTAANQTLSVAPNHTITAGRSYGLIVNTAAGSASCRLYGAEIDIDRL